MRSYRRQEVKIYLFFIEDHVEVLIRVCVDQGKTDNLCTITMRCRKKEQQTDIDGNVDGHNQLSAF